MESGLKINLGCGGDWRHSGWVGIDNEATAGAWQEKAVSHYVNCDLRRGIPFPDGSSDVIFSSHALEHFTYLEAVLVLFDVYRVLKVGGVLCIVVPDMDIYIQKYMGRDTEFLNTPTIIGGQPKDDLASNFLMNFYSDPRFNNTCHKYAYSYENLSAMLRMVGFDEIEKVSFHDFSYWPELRENAFISPIENISKFSLCLQAKKTRNAPDQFERDEYKEAYKFVFGDGQKNELMGSPQGVSRSDSQAPTRHVRSSLTNHLSLYWGQWQSRLQRQLRQFKLILSDKNRRLRKRNPNLEKQLLHAATKIPHNAALVNDRLFSPLISIVMPTYNTPRRYLIDAVESVLRQSYANWQLCIIDDGSSDEGCLDLIQAYIGQDNRIKATCLKNNAGIAHSSQIGVEKADGEYIAFLDHDDILAPAALSHFVEVLRKEPNVDMLYSDHAMFDDKGRIFGASLKPQWSPEFCLSTSYIVHFKLIKKSTLRRVDGFANTLHLSQDYGLTLKLMEVGAKIVHVPAISYFWRAHPGSVSCGASVKPGIIEAGRRTIHEYLVRNGIPASVVCPDALYKKDVGAYKLVFSAGQEPDVSVVIPTNSMSTALESLLSDLVADRRILNRNVHVVGLGCSMPINKDGIQFFRAETQSEVDAYISALTTNYIVLIHPEAEIIQKNWLDELIGYFDVSPGIGAVGGKIVDGDDIVTGGGVMLLPGYPVIGYGHPAQAASFWFTGLIASNVEAVCSEFIAIRRHAYSAAGGIDVFSSGLKSGVRCGLGLRNAGYRVVYNPWASIRINKDINMAGKEQKIAQDTGGYTDRYYSPFFDPKQLHSIKEL